MVMLVAVLGVAAFAGNVCLRRLAPELGGVSAGIAWGLLATTALIAQHLAPLALGGLSRASVLVATAVVLAAALAARRGIVRRPAEADVAIDPDRGRLVFLIAAAAALAVAGAAVAFLRAHAADPTVSSDALNFQVPQVARWMQSGSMWQLDQFFPDYSNATYPHHGNLLLLAVVLPFKAASLARLVPVPFAVLTCLGVYAAARELGAARGWALLAAALPAALPLFIKTALEGANTDTPMTFFVVAAVLFLLRHQRTRARPDLVLAGLALGLALGTKWYALTALPPMLLVWAIAQKLDRVPWRRLAADAAWLGGLALAAGGIWLARNWIEAGNPLFPQPLGPFTAPRDTIREQAGFSLADYAFDGEVWSTYLRPQFDRFIAAPGYALAAAPVLALVVARRRRAGRAAAVALAALAALAVYFVMDYSAFGPEDRPVLAFASMRYAMPALLLGAIALAWAGTQVPRVAGALLAAALGVAVLQGLHSEHRPDLSYPAMAAGALAVGIAAWAARGRGRPALAVLAVLAVAGAAVVRDRAAGRGYGALDPAIAWIEANAPAGHRVALAGVWSVDGVSPVLPAFGPRLGNEVAYAGPFDQHLLRQERDPERFRARLRDGHFDLLVVGRGIVAGRGPAPEESWARAAGAVPVLASPRLALLALPAG